MKLKILSLLIIILLIASCKKPHDCLCYHADGTKGQQLVGWVGTLKASKQNCEELHDVYAQHGGHCDFSK